MTVFSGGGKWGDRHSLHCCVRVYVGGLRMSQTFLGKGLIISKCKATSLSQRLLLQNLSLVMKDVSHSIVYNRKMLEAA